jgi:lauroyl/myristoyl acyltransferase
VTGSGEPGDPPEGSRTLRGTLLLAATGIVTALPEAPLVAAAESVGELWYRLAPARAAQARANLRRVCEGLDEQGRGTRLARRAATDPDALELLVRRCFRHTVRYYLEVALIGGVDLRQALDRVVLETPDAIREGLQSGRPVVVVGMHFGGIEVPAMVVAHLVGHRVSGPMETVADPAIQRWFETTRGRVGVTIVPVRNARRTLLAALRRGESVGLVNDRDIAGSGIPVPFFGSPAPMSPGPALLALETGTPVYAAAGRRISGGRYAGKVIAVPVPAEGTRRERVVALTAAIAAAYETLLADAPEQWWGAFHPIWPDLVVGADSGEAVSGHGSGHGPGSRAGRTPHAADEPETVP